MQQTIRRESINTVEGKPGLLLNTEKAELFSALFHCSELGPDTGGMFHLVCRMCKHRLDGVKVSQVVSSQQEPLEPGLGELPAAISKPLTAATLQMPVRPGKV